MCIRDRPITGPSKPQSINSPLPQGPFNEQPKPANIAQPGLRPGGPPSNVAPPPPVPKPSLNNPIEEQKQNFVPPVAQQKTVQPLGKAQSIPGPPKPQGPPAALPGPPQPLNKTVMSPGMPPNMSNTPKGVVQPPPTAHHNQVQPPVPTPGSGPAPIPRPGQNFGVGGKPIPAKPETIAPPQKTIPQPPQQVKQPSEELKQGQINQPVRPPTTLPRPGLPGPGLPGPQKAAALGPGGVSRPPMMGPTNPQQIAQPLAQANTQAQGGATFDVTSLQQEYMPIYETIMGASSILNQIERNPKRRQEMESKLNILFQLLAENKMNPNTIELVQSMCHEMRVNNMTEAISIHSQITKQDWENNKDWMVPLKRILTRR
eukprot:TRINITY_DN4588_c0_g1_i8.p1 TRINITY_DN4588_c0_g1~~TRINITY_DN4588_c0_g1_i8.p1  ORF type:complete len:373 (+),score=83.28 TRINITY_DN4588_c0_g1_i8:65-1183(+)